MNYLKKLFSYDRWANAQYVRALSTNLQPSGRELRLLSHIVAAQMLWMDRINNRSARAPVWPDWNLEECSRHCEQSAEEWRSLIASLDENNAQAVVTYKNSKGERRESSVEDIALHVANHGTYHRAQVAALLRADGITPPYTDYIEGVRRGNVKSE